VFREVRGWECFAAFCNRLIPSDAWRKDIIVMSYGRFAQYYDLLYRAQGKDYEREACRLHRVIQRY